MSALTKEEIIKKGTSLREEGYLVEVNFSRTGNSITINPMLLGLNLNEDENLKSFFDDFMDNNKVNFLKKNVVRKIDSISKSAHSQKRLMALGESKSYMTKVVLDDYKKYLEGKKAEYFAERDAIVSNYDIYIAEFEHDFRLKLASSTLSKLSDDEQEDMIKKVLSRIPTKQQYHDSFRVNLSLTKMTLVSEVDAEDEGSILEDTLNTVNEIAGKTLAVAFFSLNNLLDVMMNKGVLNGRNKSVFTTVSKDLEKRNIFDNKLVAEVIETFQHFKSEGSEDYEIEEKSELLMCKIYNHSKELNVSHMLDLSKCVLSEEEMEETIEAVS